MIYPGGESSIRFEKMREGIVDYEKIKILKTKASASKDPVIKSLLQQLDQHLAVFIAEKEFKEDQLKQHVQKGSTLLFQLSERLNK